MGETIKRVQESNACFYYLRERLASRRAVHTWNRFRATKRAKRNGNDRDKELPVTRMIGATMMLFEMSFYA